MTRVAMLVCVLLLIAAAGRAQPAGAQMPDPKQMSGVPLPSADLPAGTMTVRVIRGSLANPVAGQQVELSGGTQASGRTNESGRAEFTGLVPGAKIKATAVVNGETLESQEIEVPSRGGVRVMLVASDPDAARRAQQDEQLAQAPPQRGVVVLGDQSRFVFEVGDGGLNIFNIVQVVNTARVRVEPPTPVTFALPDGAEHLALLEGSSPQAVAAGSRVEVKGPFPPGVTLVQFAYTMPYSGPHLTIRHTVPAQLTQLIVVAQKLGETRVTSPQLAQQREMASEGQTYILGQGPSVPAGGTIEFNFTGLPYAPTWPRNIALTLAGLILTAGAVFSIRGRVQPVPPADRQQLTARRNELFEELTALEERHRAGRIDPDTYRLRRHKLVTSLERVYAALDEGAAA